MHVVFQPRPTPLAPGLYVDRHGWRGVYKLIGVQAPTGQRVLEGIVDPILYDALEKAGILELIHMALVLPETEEEDAATGTSSGRVLPFRRES